MSTSTIKATKRQRRRAAAEERIAARRRERQRRRLGRILGAVGIAAALVIVVVSVSGGGDGTGPARTNDITVAGPARSEPLAIGEAIPDFSAPRLSGGRVAWSDYAGRPVVLSIWAPWCPHCQVELPILDRVVGEFPGVSLVTIVTAIGDQPGPTPDGYMADHGLTFPVAVDDDPGTLGSAFGITGFPTLYFVGSDGAVVDFATGEVTEDRLRGIIRSLP
jgi:thiol-disulfide isomerase/thioredoxin